MSRILIEKHPTPAIRRSQRGRKRRNLGATVGTPVLGHPSPWRSPNPSCVPITSSILAAVHANWISVADDREEEGPYSRARGRGFVVVRPNREDKCRARPETDPSGQRTVGGSRKIKIARNRCLSVKVKRGQLRRNVWQRGTSQRRVRGQ